MGDKEEELVQNKKKSLCDKNKQKSHRVAVVVKVSF